MGRNTLYTFKRAFSIPLPPLQTVPAVPTVSVFPFSFSSFSDHYSQPHSQHWSPLQHTQSSPHQTSDYRAAQHATQYSCQQPHETTPYQANHFAHEVGLHEARRVSREELTGVLPERPLCGDRQPSPRRLRNAATRGLRSQSAILKRRKGRSDKRKSARQSNRDKKRMARNSRVFFDRRGQQATQAQEPVSPNYTNINNSQARAYFQPKSKPEASCKQDHQTDELVSRKLRYNTTIKVVSVNIRGLNKIAKRQQLVDYLHSQQIDIALLQETKVKHKGTEKLSNYTAFFSSQTPTLSHRPRRKEPYQSSSKSKRVLPLLKVIKKQAAINPGSHRARRGRYSRQELVGPFNSQSRTNFQPSHDPFYSGHP